MNLKIADVKEKEIDFLIAEEFACNPSFLSLFLDEFKEYNGKSFKVNRIKRSHTDSYGESDLEIFLKDDDNFNLALLIENKVSAQFQNDQLLRYHMRGQSYIKRSECDDFKVILVAPIKYGYEDPKEIDFRLYYEDLIEWFANNATTNKRYKFKEILLNRALQRATLGYQPIEDEQATHFWKEYWQLANKIAPVLNMPKPGKRPSAASFIYFAPSDLPSGLSLVNKVKFGVIDLQIAGMANYIGPFRAEFENRFEVEYDIIKTGKSVSIREEAPILDIQKSVNLQEKYVQITLEKSLKLYHWYRRNSVELNTIMKKWLLH